MSETVTIEIDVDAEYPVDTDECEEYFGHAYTVDPVTLQSNPPQKRRTCQICGDRQTKFTRDPNGWS